LGGYTISVCNSQQDQLSLASLRGRLIEYQLRLGKGGNVTSAGWQVTLCDPIVAAWQLCEVLYTGYLLTYRTIDVARQRRRCTVFLETFCGDKINDVSDIKETREKAAMASACGLMHRVQCIRPRTVCQTLSCLLVTAILI